MRTPLLFFLGALLVLSASSSRAADADTISEYPSAQPSRFYLDVSEAIGPIGPGSIIRVREFRHEGTGLHFGTMGIDTAQMQTLDFRAWLDPLDAIRFQFRYFDLGGKGHLSQPAWFNGSLIAGGQNLDTDPSTWFSLAVYYQRRLTPIIRRYEQGAPEALKHWDVSAGIGLEYTYINFELDQPRLSPVSPGSETKEDFMHQELPIPTLMLDAFRQLNDRFTIEASLKFNWINRWNSLRHEGGTVWLSQDGEEMHLRLLYENRDWLDSVHPMLGFYVYRYSQTEISHEDGNFVRWSSFGPEFGVSWGF